MKVLIFLVSILLASYFLAKFMCGCVMTAHDFKVLIAIYVLFMGLGGWIMTRK